MKTSRLVPVTAAVVLGLAACESSTSTSNPILTNDAAITADVAASSGDAIASAVGVMAANETDVGLPNAAVAEASPDLSVERTRTCFDASDNVVAGCSPLSSVRKIAWGVTINGSRSGSSTTECVMPRCCSR